MRSDLPNRFKGEDWRDLPCLRVGVLFNSEPSGTYRLQVVSGPGEIGEGLRLHAGQHQGSEVGMDGQDQPRGRTKGMRIVDISLKTAEEYLSKHERHYKAPVEAICAIAVVDEEKGNFHGAAILGRREPGVGELAHIYVDGASQGYSLLYGACWRALKALGYEKTVL